MWILLQAAFGLWNANLFQPFHTARIRSVAAQTLVQLQYFAHLRAHRHRWGERRERVLEDHRHFRAANCLQRFLVSGQKVLIMKFRFACDASVLRKQPHCRQNSLAFARPGLAHDAEAFARRDLKAGAFHGMHFAIRRIKTYVQVFDGKYGIGHRKCLYTTCWSVYPFTHSPRKALDSSSFHANSPRSA